MYFFGSEIVQEPNWEFLEKLASKNITYNFAIRIIFKSSYTMRNKVQINVTKSNDFKNRYRYILLYKIFSLIRVKLPSWKIVI